MALEAGQHHAALVTAHQHGIEQGADEFGVVANLRVPEASDAQRPVLGVALAPILDDQHAKDRLGPPQRLLGLTHTSDTHQDGFNEHGGYYCMGEQYIVAAEIGGRLVAMCGRYMIHGPQSRYRDYFDAREGFDFEPRYNVAPSLILPVVQQGADGMRRFVAAKWGLVPAWLKDPTQCLHPINARAETAAIKPMFRDAFRCSRVLVPADGFYEWRCTGREKQPYLIRRRDGAPLGIAGLLAHWQGPEGQLVTFTILTVDANPLVAPLHDRMPAIVKPEDYARWLDPVERDIERLMALLAPYPERLIEVCPVSRKVNDPANDGPDLIGPLPTLV